MAPDSLLRYLQIKVHHLIQDHHWDSIRVVVGRNPFGAYDRVAGEGRHLTVRLVDSTVVIDAR